MKGSLFSFLNAFLKGYKRTEIKNYYSDKDKKTVIYIILFLKHIYINKKLMFHYLINV